MEIEKKLVCAHQVIYEIAQGFIDEPTEEILDNKERLIKKLDGIEEVVYEYLDNTAGDYEQ